MTPEVVTVDVTVPAHGGTVIARHEGQVVFVRGALPGEAHLDVELDPEQGNTGRAKSFRTGRAVRVGAPSEHRVTPVCPAAALGAGCCDLDFVDAQGSAEFKTAVVLDQLSRIGRLTIDAKDSGVALHTTSLEPQSGWRTKVRLGVDERGTVGTRKRNSRQIIPLAEAVCAQIHPDLARELVDQVDSLASSGKIRPNTDIVAAIGDGQESVKHPAISIVEVTNAQRDHRHKNKQHRNRRHRNRRRAGERTRESHRRVLAGAQTIEKTLRIGGLTRTWRTRADNFWQGHRDATQFYADWIAAVVPATVEFVETWDLYGGAGVFGTVLADKAPHGHTSVVDIASAATECGREALHDLVEHRQLDFVAGDVAKALPVLKESLGEKQHGASNRAPTHSSLHAVVLDPPRTGAGAVAIRQVAECAPQHVVHIGCDPATAARDLKTWSECGYAIEKLEVVDAFGLTHHVELLAYLRPQR